MKIYSINDLASLVKSRRKGMGLTQVALAKKIGVKPLWISQFENGKATVQLGLVLRTLKVMDLSITIGLPAADSLREDDAAYSSYAQDSGAADIIDLDSIINPQK